MANNTCAQPPELYQGDGSTTKFSFSFQYIKPADIAVFLWNDITKEYDKCTLVDSNACTGQPTEYYFENSTPVEITFCVAPGLPPDNRGDNFSNIIVGRETDICQMVAYFYPGTSIRAQDLNNDFTQILLAIQDLPAQVLRLLAETTINVDQIEPLIKAVDMDEATVWDDNSLPTSGAAKRYFENLYQDTPPDPNQRYERGKLWYQRYTTNLGKDFQAFSIYDGAEWQTITAGEVVPNPFTPQSILYVDPQGDDGNPGRRPDEAFRTIKRAVEVANTATAGTVTTVNTALYDEVSGFVNIETTANHNLISGVTVTISPMIWNCTQGDEPFPAVSKDYRVSAVTGPTTFRIYVGPNQYVHTYVSGGVVTPKDSRLGDGYTIRCAPGVYAEKFPIQIFAKNLSIIGSSLRNTYVHPDITGEVSAGKQQGVDIYPGELETMFEMDSGSYLTDFTFAGLKSL